MLRVESSVVLLVQLTDVVTRLQPLARTYEFLRYFPVVQSTAIFNPHVAEAVEPVVAVYEYNCSVRHDLTKKKPRRVGVPDTGGVNGPSPKGRS